MSFGDNRIAAFTLINLARSAKWIDCFVDNRIPWVKSRSRMRRGCVEDATKRGQNKGE